MMVRAFFVIAVVLQLQFSVRGNCTTELSEIDDAEATSLQNEPREDDFNSTKSDDPATGTVESERTNPTDNGIGVIENSTTSASQGSSQDNGGGIGKDVAENSTLDEVSPDKPNQDNPIIPQTMIDLGELAVHKNPDTIDVDADKFDAEGHMTTVIDLGELTSNKKALSSIQEGMPNTTSGIQELNEDGFEGDNDMFDDGNHMTPGAIINFKEPDNKNKSPSNDENPTDTSENPELDDYEITVNITNGKRLKRQNEISNDTTVEVTDKSINQSTATNNTDQANASDSQDVEAPNGTANTSNIETLIKRIKSQEVDTAINNTEQVNASDSQDVEATNGTANTSNIETLIKRFKRQEVDTAINGSAGEGQDVASTSPDVQANDTTSTTSTDAQTDETTTTKKLRRFPSLQFLARRVITDNDGKFSPSGGRIREKRSHIYSFRPEDEPESLRAPRQKLFKKLQRKLRRKHFHTV